MWLLSHYTLMSMLMDVDFGMSLALNETEGPLQETLPFHFVDTSHCHILDLPLVTLSHFRLFFAYLPSFISAYFLVGQQFPL